MGKRQESRDKIEAQIIELGRHHLVTQGAAGLSLRAVARDLGMVSSAVYRYVASRDDLLTLLLVDAYSELADAVDRAAAACGPWRDQLLAMAHAARAWAVDQPARWALLYGSPVPGYHAPQDTVGPATRVIMQIVAIVQDAARAGAIELGPPITGRYADELAAAGAVLGDEVPPQLVGSTFAAFVHLCGAVSTELFGQLDKTVDDDRRGFLDFQMRGAARLIGLTS
jgi:AcrR family transcriptional regulator